MLGMNTKMVKIGLIFGVVAIAGLTVYLYHKRQEALQAEIQQTRESLGRSENAREALKESMSVFEKKMDKRIRQYREEIDKLSKQYEEAQSKRHELEELLSRHDLSYLAQMKPGLIENRVNKGTKEVFTNLEDLTSNFNKERTDE